MVSSALPLNNLRPPQVSGRLQRAELAVRGLRPRGHEPGPHRLLQGLGLRGRPDVQRVAVRGRGGAAAGGGVGGGEGDFPLGAFPLGGHSLFSRGSRSTDRPNNVNQCISNTDLFELPSFPSTYSSVLR